MRLLSTRFKPKKARIELIPMIDTMVFLLVFFMVASLAMSKQKGIPVALPVADSANKATWADRALVITAESDGKLFLNKTQVERDKFEATLSESLKASPNQVVVINADESLRHKEVVWLMDEAKLAGASQMVIATNGNGGEEIEKTVDE